MFLIGPLKTYGSVPLPGFRFVYILVIRYEDSQTFLNLAVVFRAPDIRGLQVAGQSKTRKIFNV